MSDDRIPLRSIFSAPIQMECETPSAFCIICTGSTAMCKAVRAFRWPHTRSSAEVKSRVQKKHLLPLFVFMACQRVNITIHYFIHIIIDENGIVLNATGSVVLIGKYLFYVQV